MATAQLSQLRKDLRFSARVEEHATGIRGSKEVFSILGDTYTF